MEDRSANLSEPLKPVGQKRYKLIACEIFYREFCKLVSESDNLIDIEFLRKGLHDVETCEMLGTIQEAINAVEPELYDAILLGYGRCNNGVVGLYTKEYPVVIPRSHDCIGVFWGSCDRYKAFFESHPGTFYRTSGWTERDYSPNDSVMSQLGLNMTRQQYIDKYGEENAQYIMETTGAWVEHYQYLAYIDMGLEIDMKYIELAKREAAEKKLEFMRIEGDLSILRNMLSGKWDDNYIILEPGNKLVADESGQILNTEKI